MRDSSHKQHAPPAGAFPVPASPFAAHAQRYDGWFDRHPAIYAAELEALRAVLPPFHRALEVGVGTGRFATPLGIPLGVDPARAMARQARARGLTVVGGVAEALPFARQSFDLVLMVTTICFVADAERALAEARRVLEPQGAVALGFVDRASPLGSRYKRRRATSPFYAGATFFREDELVERLARAGLPVRVTRRIRLLDAPAGTACAAGEAGDFTVLVGAARRR